MRHQYDRTHKEPHKSFGSIKIAVCGNLPTACDYLLKEGVMQIDKFNDATEIISEKDYHLILIYAPGAEGLLNTQYVSSSASRESIDPIPIRLLNEPCCHSALLELRSTIKRISKKLTSEALET